MHVVKLLHDLLDNACTTIDRRIVRTLFSAVEALTRCRRLSISGLGRSLDRQASVKNSIKCMDRLFGNATLHEKNAIAYQAMCHLLLKGNRRPVIIVDWSGLTACGTFHFLSASVVVKGRSFTLYSQAYSLKEYMKEKTHRDFLNVLCSLLPKGSKPIVITDAGFRNTWFRAVSDFGWNYIGRVRNRTYYCQYDLKIWLPIKSLFEQATQKAKYVSRVFLARESKFDCHLYLMKKRNMNRIKRNISGKKAQCSVSKKHARSAREPWLIASSFSPKEMPAASIMRLYKKRMQIEEVFRDLKNMRNGLGLRDCRSFRVERLSVALLIGALAMFVLWIFGITVEQKKQHYSFQSNTIRNRSVLSTFMIGWQVLMRKQIILTKKECLLALKYIASIAATGDNYAE